MTLPLLPVLAALVAVILIGVLFRRLTVSRHQFENLPPGWEEIEPRRYAPLARLLAREDFAYLRTLPGYDPKLERVLRRRRLDAFRHYLSALVKDFDTLQRVGHLLVATGEASPMLREQLLLARLAFTRALWQVRVEMVLFRLSGRAVDSGRLLAALQDACGALQVHPPHAAEA